MYVQGVSTRRVKRITEELCGTEISSTQVSRMAKILDEGLAEFRKRSLDTILYLYLDATYHKVRYQGQVIDVAALTAVGVNADGYREVLGVSYSLSEAEVHWRKFLENLFQRGMCGVKLIISDDHAGLRKALKAISPSTPWQRCIFHLAQNAQHYVPQRHMRKDAAESEREIYQVSSIEEAEERLRKIANEWEERAPDFSRWLEENFREGLTFLSFPKEHRRKIRTVNVVERLNQEMKRRTRVARLFPNPESCERLVTAIARDVHEDWMSGKRYLVM